MLTARHYYLENTYIIRLRNDNLSNQKVLCLLHGFPANTQKNYDLAQLLCLNGYAVYLFHYDGLGFSKGSFSFIQSLEVSRKIYKHIAEKEGNLPLSLLGHSWGGYLALHTFMKIKNRDKLVLLAPYSEFPPEEKLLVFFKEIKKECAIKLSALTAEEIVKEIKCLQQEFNNNIFTGISDNSVFVLQGWQDNQVTAEQTEKLAKKFTKPITAHFYNDDHLFSQNRREMLKIVNN